MHLLLLLLAADGRYVEASVANVRAAPAADAEVVAKLPIAKPVTVLEQLPGWVRVKAGKATGWVAGGLLTDERPTLRGLLARYDSTPPTDLIARRSWAERAAALAPHDLRALARLKEAVVAVDDKGALQQVLTALDTHFRTSLSVEAGPTEAVFDRLWWRVSERLSPCPCPWRGIRSVYEGLHALMSLQELTALAPMPIFVGGPHGAETLVLDSPADHARYNPAFVQWLTDWAIPGSRRAEDWQWALQIYHRFLDRQPRVYYGEWLELNRDPELRAAHARREPRGGNAFRDFWHRRVRDGTAEQFVRGLEKLLVLYDTAGYLELSREYEQPAAAAEAAAPGPVGLHLARPGPFHAGEIAARDGERMLALSDGSRGWTLTLHTVRVETVVDELVDGPGEASGKVVKLPSGEVPLLLIGGSQLRPGKVTSASLEPSCFQPHQKCTVKLGKLTYTVTTRASVPEQLESGSTKNRLTLHITDGSAETVLHNVGSLPFIGDLDRDGRLDVVVESVFHYNVIYDYTLYLSTKAPPGHVLAPVASFTSTGC